MSTNNSASHHRHYYPTPSYHSSSSSSSKASFRGCCCCLCLLLSFLALLSLALLLILLLALRPKKPQFHLQQVSVHSLSISPSPSSAASLSLSILLLFSAVNPNKVGIKYSHSSFTAMYRGIPLGKAVVPAFYQEPHSVRNVEAVVAVDRVSLFQADAADLIRDASVNDRVELRIVGDVGAKIRIFNFDSPTVQASVNCVVVISPRKQSLTDKQCGFDGLNV